MATVHLPMEVEASSMMRAITAAPLRNAYGGEAIPHMRCKVWGDRAEHERFPDVCRLLKAIASAEQVHASNHFRELASEVSGFLCASMAVFGLSSPSHDLHGGIDVEIRGKEQHRDNSRNPAAGGTQRGQDTNCVDCECEPPPVGKAHQLARGRRVLAAEGGKLARKVNLSIVARSTAT